MKKTLNELQVSETAKVFAGVKLGKNVFIGDYCLVGVPQNAGGELCETKIGDGAIIRSHSVIYAGNNIGKNFSCGHGALLRECNEVGDDVSIGSHSDVEHHVKIGDGVRVHSNAFIPEYSVLEERAWIGPCVVMTNALHPACPSAKKCLKGPTIKRGAKVGANATILPRVVVGENSLVGAGSVVTRDVPAGVVVAGNPARAVKKVGGLRCPFGLVEKPY